MRPYGSFGSLLFLNAFLCIVMGLYRSLCVLMGPYVFLLFLMRLYGL